MTESLSANPVDVVLDLIGGRAALQSVAVTKPGGIVVEIPDGGYIDDLTRTAAADGALTPTISEIYELADAAKAHHAIEGGHTQGKILLRPW